MATAIPMPNWQTDNNDGSFASGGKIYFWVPGTSTARTPFSDSDLTVPTTNPVILNAAGWPETPIYLSSELAYEYEVKSADDANTFVPRRLIPATVAGAQPADATLTAVAGLTIVDDGYIQGTGPDTFRVRYLQRATYAQLTAIAAGDRFDGMRVYVSARTTQGDGAEGWWRFDAASSATANGGTILAPDAGTGRWLRIDTTVLKPRQFGAAGDGTTNDSAAWQALIGALVDGSQVDGEGKTYRIVTTLSALKASGAPDNVTIRNCNFLPDGGTSDDTFRVYGAGVALTSVGTVSAGATTVTATGAVAGDAGKWLLLTSTDKTAPVKADSYTSGEMVQIRSVSGTTITLETPTKLAYSTGQAATLVTTIKNWNFYNCSFTGDPAKTQDGVRFYRAENCYAETRGLNMGYATQFWEQSVFCEFQHSGGNPGITSDNGTDYGVVAGNGCVGLHGHASGYEYRHVFASGGTTAVDFFGAIEIIAESMKDAALDAHPNVLALTCSVITRRPRNGGTFSNQPAGLAWQGGGYLDAEVTVDGYATSAVLLQPHQGSSKDHVHVRGHAFNPTSAATRGIEADLYKAGGSIETIYIDFVAEGLTEATSRAVNIDTNNCASGVSINSIVVFGHFEGAVYGVVAIQRSGHTINSVRYEGKAKQTTSGGYGWAMLGTSSGIAIGQFIGCITTGAAGAFGIRANNVVHSTAVGCRATDVGGAGITNNAEVTITLSVGGSYT
jgi:hypothetical protein